MRRLPGWSILVAFALVGVAAEGAPRAHGASAGLLTEHVWVLATLAGKAPLAGTEPTASFTTAGRVTGSTGCNRFTGTYRASGRTLRIPPPATTQMACAAPVARQERAFVRALTSTRTFTVRRGTLTLRSTSGRRLATFRAQTQALAGTSWTVLAYNNGKEAVVSVLADTQLTAVFGRDDRLTGFAGCNTYNAGFEATPPRIRIGPVASTQKACAEPAGVSEQEARFLLALETAVRYRVEGSLLELRTVDGALAVQLQRSAP